MTAPTLEPVELHRDSFPPGCVAIPCNDLARYHHFTHDLTMLDVPDGTTIAMHRSASIVHNLNQIIGSLPDHAEWVWIIGDDHVFDRDIVLKLLAHQVDIVAPLCTRRGPPFGLVAFDRQEGWDDLGRPLYHILQIDELPEHGLHPVVAAGTAGMLVKRHVFDRIGEPWFANSDAISTNEDLEFCRKARDAGFEVMLDVDSRIGHLGVFSIWPDRQGGQWGVTLDFQGQGRNHIFLAGGVRPNDQGAPYAATGALDWQ